MLDTAFIGYRVQHCWYKILGKTSYTLYYKTYETHLRESVHNSMKNQLFTQAFVFVVILMQCKI